VGPGVVAPVGATEGPVEGCVEGAVVGRCVGTTQVVSVSAYGARRLSVRYTRASAYHSGEDARGRGELRCRRPGYVRRAWRWRLQGRGSSAEGVSDRRTRRGSDSHSLLKMYPKRKTRGPPRSEAATDQ
jgi:hypothetical protein